jgi:predicted nucleotidyltransferase
MKHEEHTKRLRQMLTALCTTSFRAIPLELYVFGSYARGALNPGDLDLFLVYEPPPTFEAECKEYREKYGFVEGRRRGGVEGEYKREFNRIFKKRGKDITYDFRGHRIKSIRNNEDGLLLFDDFVLLWSRDDQDWESKLQSIKINPNAGRAYRNHFFDLDRLKCTLETHDRILEAIEKKELVLTKVPVEDKTVPVLSNAEHNRLIKIHGCEWRRTSDAVVRIMKYGFSWFESEKQVSWRHSSDNIWVCESKTHAILLNTPIRYIWWVLRRCETTQKACWIPVIKARQENVMLIFERGPNWTTEN